MGIEIEMLVKTFEREKENYFVLNDIDVFPFLSLNLEDRNSIIKIMGKSDIYYRNDDEITEEYYNELYNKNVNIYNVLKNLKINKLSIWLIKNKSNLITYSTGVLKASNGLLEKERVIMNFVNEEELQYDGKTLIRMINNLEDKYGLSLRNVMILEESVYFSPEGTTKWEELIIKLNDDSKYFGKLLEFILENSKDRESEKDFNNNIKYYKYIKECLNKGFKFIYSV